MSKKERYWFEESWVPVEDARAIMEAQRMWEEKNGAKCSALPEDTRGDPDFLAALVDIEALHKNKSSTYGTSDDSFANFTDVGIVTGKPPEYYALLRIVEKCSRAVHQIDAGNAQDVKEWPDIAGLALCCEALKRKTAREGRLFE